MIKRTMNIKTRIKQTGFTLIELAIVLVIVGVLIGSFIGSLTQRIENSRIAETEDQLEEIKTALLGYAYTNGHLPCPDCFLGGPLCPGAPLDSGDGAEDRNVSVCSSGNNVGTLPWVTLGLAQGDAWGTRYRYWVDTNYANNATTFTLTPPAGPPGGGQIWNRTDDGTAIQPLANSIVAVIFSHGKNTYGGMSTGGIATPAIPAVNLDEKDNWNGNKIFISRPPSAAGATTAGGEFDDILTWITEFELKAKMVEAGRLP